VARKNRMALKNADVVYGTLDEQKALRLDPGDYMSCGDPMHGVERCQFAEECNFAWKGKEGLERVIDIDPKTLKVILKDGKPVVTERPAGGPKTVAVYRKDGWTEKIRVMMLPCYRYLSNMKRWSRKDANGRGDIVALLAREGDGKMVPMSETAEKQVGTNRNGSPKMQVSRVSVHRAVPFHDRPVDMMPERLIDLEVEDLLKRRAVEDAAVVVAGLRAEDRPIDLSGGMEVSTDIIAGSPPKDQLKNAARTGSALAGE